MATGTKPKTTRTRRAKAEVQEEFETIKEEISEAGSYGSSKAEKVDHFPSTHAITVKDLRNMKKHIKDTEFSGIIGIFDGKSTHFENQKIKLLWIFLFLFIPLGKHSLEFWL